MKMTLGGKLSIAVAASIAASWMSWALAEPDAYHVQVNSERAIHILSFPLGLLAGIFESRAAGSALQFYLYLLLLIPNSFILGYSMAGLVHLLRPASRSSCPMA